MSPRFKKRQKNIIDKKKKRRNLALIALGAGLGSVGSYMLLRRAHKRELKQIKKSIPEAEPTLEDVLIELIKADPEMENYLAARLSDLVRTQEVYEKSKERALEKMEEYPLGSRLAKTGLGERIANYYAKRQANKHLAKTLGEIGIISGYDPGKPIKVKLNYNKIASLGSIKDSVSSFMGTTHGKILLGLGAGLLLGGAGGWYLQKRRQTHGGVTEKIMKESPHYAKYFKDIERLKVEKLLLEKNRPKPPEGFLGRLKWTFGLDKDYREYMQKRKNINKALAARTRELYQQTGFGDLPIMKKLK